MILRIGIENGSRKCRIKYYLPRKINPQDLKFRVCFAICLRCFSSIDAAQGVAENMSPSICRKTSEYLAKKDRIQSVTPWYSLNKENRLIVHLLFRDLFLSLRLNNRAVLKRSIHSSET